MKNYFVKIKNKIINIDFNSKFIGWIIAFLISLFIAFTSFHFSDFNGNKAITNLIILIVSALSATLLTFLPNILLLIMAAIFFIITLPMRLIEEIKDLKSAGENTNNMKKPYFLYLMTVAIFIAILVGVTINHKNTEKLNKSNSEYYHSELDKSYEEILSLHDENVSLKDGQYSQWLKSLNEDQSKLYSHAYDYGYNKGYNTGYDEGFEIGQEFE